MPRHSPVTPFVGVWIETSCCDSSAALCSVTPFVGVWIETFVWYHAVKSSECHTLRGCVDWNYKYACIHNDRTEGHTLRGCVDWNYLPLNIQIAPYSHTLRGCVDWNSQALRINSNLEGHTLRGCVDWNSCAPGQLLPISVTPFVGVWIETFFTEDESVNDMSHPSWVCGLKLLSFSVMRSLPRSHPSWVCGLKLSLLTKLNKLQSHTLRGCVDWNMFRLARPTMLVLSHPSWVCGLKPL